MLFAVINASSSGSNAIVAAVSGYRIAVVAYVVKAAGAVTFTWLSAATSISGPMPCGSAGDGVATPYPPDSGGRKQAYQMQTAVGEALNLSLDSAVAVGGHLVYELVK